MGKAIVISHIADAKYNIQLTFMRARFDAIIVSLNSQISILTTLIATLPDGTEKNLATLKKTALQKRIEYMNANMPSDPTIAAWCADLTTDLTGTVGTIEVPGERGSVLIQPGFDSNAVYNSVRDGQLAPSLNNTPEGLFYNLVILPGWQKWKPTYRHGIISNIDISLDTCDISLDTVKSSQQSLNINQEGSLSDIPIEYMSCNSSAFENGDHVLVKFEGQEWSGAKVIGFVDEPKQCTILCEDIIEENLSFDIASSLSYEVDQSFSYGFFSTWTKTVIDIDTSSGLEIDFDVLFERAYNGRLPSPIVYTYNLKFMLSESIDLVEGWYYLTYNFETTPITANTVIIPVGGWETGSDIQAETLCRNGNCKFHGTRRSKVWAYIGGEEIIVDSFVECGDGRSGSYTECIELKSENKGASIHTNALDIQIIMYSSSKGAFDVEFAIRNFGIIITNLSLKKVKNEVIDPICSGESVCGDAESCVSPATWSGFYVGGW